MPAYTVSADPSPLLRDREEGQLIDVQIDVLRDGEVVGVIDQRYGVDVANPELLDDLRRQIKAIVLEDYEALQKADLQSRCDQIGAVLNDWSETLP